MMYTPASPMGRPSDRSPHWNLIQDMITKQWTLRSVVLRHPEVVKTLEALGIQPGQGYMTIEAVANRLQKTPETLVDELTQAVSLR